MRDACDLWLRPFPPTTNNLFSTGIVNGRPTRFPSSRYKKWRKMAGACLHGIKPFVVPVAIRIELTPPDLRPRDADNYNKAPIDLLVEAGILLGDDSRHIKEVSARWLNPDPGTAGAHVFLAPALILERPPLTAGERAMLERIKAAGTLLVRPTFRSSGALRSLLDKGYACELPGLINGFPQGFVAIEATRDGANDSSAIPSGSAGALRV